MRDTASSSKTRLWLGIAAAPALVALTVWFALVPPGLGRMPLALMFAFTVAAAVLSGYLLREPGGGDQHELLRVALSSIGDAVITTDAQGVITSLNRVAETLTGWDRDAAVGTRLAEVFNVIDENTRRPLEELITGVLRERTAVPLASRAILVNRYGREIPIDGSGTPVADARGTVRGIIAVFRDVTDSRRSERELQRSQERLGLAQEAGNMGTWDWNISTGSLTWTGSLESIHGFVPGEFRETLDSFLEAVHPENRDQVAASLQLALQDKSNLEMEYRVAWRDGSIHWVESKGRAFYDENGKPVRVIGYGADITERKKWEEALRASEERFAKAFTSSPLPKWICTLDGGWLLDVNEAFVWATGYTREEVLGRAPGEFSLWVEPDDENRLLRTAREQRRARDLEFRFRRKSGDVRLFLLSLERITLEGKSCFLAVANDITERKHAEEALRESEQRFRRMADAAPVMIWMSGPDKQRTYFNQGWLELTGRSMDEELGFGWIGGVHPEDAGHCMAAYSAAFESRSDFRMEYRLRRSDGEYRWIMDVGVPLVTADGDFGGYIGSCMDITERRRAEEEREQLLTRAETARSAAESAGKRAVFLAEASRILASSLEYETTFSALARLAVDNTADWCGIDIAEDDAARRVATAHRDGCSWAETYPDPGQDSGVRNVLSTGTPQVVPNVREGFADSAACDEAHVRKLRDLGVCSYMCIPLVARGNVLGAISLAAAEPGRYGAEDLRLVQDLAARAALAIDNARLYRAAQDANRTKDEFLATVSHELRTPLNSILGWSRMLRTGRLDEENASKALEIIERNARMQAQLIEDLLDISRIVSGKLRLDVRPVDLMTVVDAAIDSVRLAAEGKGIRLQQVLDTGIGPAAGDPERLQQVVWNLLSNAIKFTPKGGCVQVRLERVGSNAQIVVSDTGIGISPEFLPHVFERFRQGDGSTARKHTGLGLGLAIASQLVELHGGSIRVESAGRGQGATFYVALPITAVTSTRVQLPGRRHTLGDVELHAGFLEGVRVLVVEDEPDARQVLGLILGQYGAQVSCVGTASEAFDVLSEDHSFDVLISDIDMPGEDGYSLLRRLRALEAMRGQTRVPAAALTAYGRTEDRMQALSAGFQIHVPKPVEPAELLAVVASLTGRASELQART